MSPSRRLWERSAQSRAALADSSPRAHTTREDVASAPREGLSRIRLGGEPTWPGGRLLLIAGLLTGAVVWFVSDLSLPDPVVESEYYMLWKIAGLSLLSAIGVTAARLWGASSPSVGHRAGHPPASISSTYDTVTGLPTKRLFTTLVNQALSRGQKGGHRIAVLMVDLDHFTLGGDLQGQASSNMIYRVQAARVKSALRSSDTVARMAERSFGVLLDHVTGPAEVVAIAKKMQRTVSLPYTLEGHELFLTSRIGFELSSTPIREASDLLEAAAHAVEKARTEGCVIYGDQGGVASPMSDASDCMASPQRS